MLIMIKNANIAGRDNVVFPHSKLKLSIAECLLQEGYISSINKKTKHGRPFIEVVLKYNADKTPKVSEIKRISKPSCRVYYGSRDIFPVKSGHGTLVLSTPKGIMTGNMARKELVGGEALFKIW